MQIKNLTVDSRVISVEYPGLEGFFLDISYLSKDTLLSMRTKCVTKKFNKKTRQPEDDFDLELFNTLFVKQAIKGWKGFKSEYLETFMVVDLTGVEPDECIEYSEENALELLKHSSEFDSWLSEVLGDLDNFRTKREG